MCNVNSFIAECDCAPLLTTTMNTYIYIHKALSFGKFAYEDIVIVGLSFQMCEIRCGASAYIASVSVSVSSHLLPK